MAELGIDRDAIEVNYIGVDLDPLAPGERAAEPTLLFLGRLKRYKRIEVLLDVLEQCPRRGAGDRRRGRPPPGAGARDRRARAGRPRPMHGHVDEESKRRAAPARVGEHDRVLGRGLVPDRHGGRGLRDPQRRPCRGRPARVHRRRPHRPAGPRRPPSWAPRSAAWCTTPSCATAWAPRRWSAHATFTWEAAAQRSLDSLEPARDAEPQLRALRSRAPTPAARPGWPPR